MSGRDVERDERTVSIENTSYRWGYLLLSYGLLLSTAYRAFVRQEQAWDLLGLVMLGGLITSLYQGRQRVLSRRWLLVSAAAALLAACIAAVLVLMAR